MQDYSTPRSGCRCRREPCARESTPEVAPLAASLFHEANVADHHALVDRLDHVVDRERRHGDEGDQRQDLRLSCAEPRRQRRGRRPSTTTTRSRARGPAALAVYGRRRLAGLVVSTRPGLGETASRSGPVVPLEPAALNVWQPSQPSDAKSCLPAIARSATADSAVRYPSAAAIAVSNVSVVNGLGRKSTAPSGGARSRRCVASVTASGPTLDQAADPRPFELGLRRGDGAPRSRVGRRRHRP